MRFSVLIALAAGWWGGGPGAPEVPDALRIPKGHKFLFRAEAEGVQIYVSQLGTTGKPHWVLKAPLAGLTQAGKKAGYHYAGPSWEADDGSKVVRDAADPVASSPAPDAKKDIPWLRIKVKADGKTDGVFGGVTYVLRMNTRGGVMPARTPVRAGTEVGVPYRATYYFYGPAK
jgi:hypothetical protein